MQVAALAAGRAAPAPDLPTPSGCLYARADYAAALAHMGAPLDVPEWGGPVLARRFGAARDAVGPYPLTSLAGDAGLGDGLERLRAAGLVSIVLTPDPLAGPSAAELGRAFGLCRPFKTHWLVGEGGAPCDPSKHHRERIRRGHRRCRVERVRLADHLDTWTTLYAGLLERRSVGGAADFPPGYFAMLARQPELVAFTAFVGEAVAAMTLWFAHAGVAYNHLTASDDIGRANGASFALYDAALTHFGGCVANLGGGAGLADDPDDGLAAFKRGFASSSVQAHLCGAVLDRAAYARFSAGRQGGGFFPAYRTPASPPVAAAGPLGEALTGAPRT